MAEIVLIEPFFGGSHQRWVTELAQHSKHNIHLLTLPARHWKWRMHGAAVSLAASYLEAVKSADLILASDMLDLSSFVALIAKSVPIPPLAIYMHENQLTYPWSPSDEDTKLQRDRHYAWINYTSALVADRVFFNSSYHLNSFLDALPDYLSKFPDHQDKHRVKEIAKKSEVLYLGMSLSGLDLNEKTTANETPHLLWNHRWEYDKNPELFFESCFRLEEEGIDFRLIVLGEKYRNSPAIFDKAKNRLKSKIAHWGYLEKGEDYRLWLNRADILAVSSRQDFFGGSIVEAMYAGAYPILPYRLAYPEHIPEQLHSQHFYHQEEEFYAKLKSTVLSFPLRIDSRIKDRLNQYDWQQMVHHYDQVFADLL